MIKRIDFATRSAGTDPAAFAAAWRDAAAAAAAAPPGTRPLRIAVCRALPDVEADPPHDAVSIEWFADLDHLRRFEAWLRSGAGAPAGEPGAAAADPSRSAVVVAEEVVLRGADWLATRWEQGGPKLKHMALARRATGLTPEELSARWKARGGTVGRPGTAGALTVPPEARGRAYAQDHPLPAAHGEGGPPYDAVNEVWFDDVEALAARVAWFAQHPPGAAEGDLFGDHRFLAVEEEPVAVEPGGVPQ